MTESQKSGALRAFIVALLGGAMVAGYVVLGPSSPDARLTEGVAWVDCSSPEARAWVERADLLCQTGYYMTHTCVPPDGPDAGPLPESTPGLMRLAHQARDMGPCDTDGGTWVRVYGPDSAPWEAACGPGCKMLDGGDAPAGNRYLAPGTFKEPLPTGCFRRPEAEWAGLDGTPAGCLSE